MNTSLPANPATHAATRAQNDLFERTSDAALTDLARLAAYVCGTPIAALTQCDTEHSRLTAYHGPDEALALTNRLVCNTSTGATELVLVPDLGSTEHADLSSGNGTSALRFYAALPLLGADGQARGTLSVLDYEPRTLSDGQRDALRTIGHQTLAQLGQQSGDTERLAAQMLDAAMLSSVDCLALVLDQQGRIVRFNHACEQQTGYTLDEIRGKAVWDVFMPASEAAQAEAEFAELQPDTLPIKLTHTWITKDGQRQRMTWSSTALLDDQGAISYIVSTSQPERRAKKTSFQREQTFLTAMLDNLEDGIIACDAEGVITLFNRATREFHGIPTEPIPAAQWADHFTVYQPDGRTPMAMEEIPLYRALQGELVHNIEIVIAPHNGVPRTLLANGQPIVDAQGNKLGAVITMHNITERKQAEQARYVSEERLRMLISNAPIMFYTYDRDGIITMCDGKALREIGVMPNQHIGVSAFDLYQGLDDITNDVRRALAGESFQVTRKAGPHAFDIWYESLRDEYGALNGALAITINVTERHRATEERERLQAEMIRVQAATLAELSTPLIPLNDQIVVMPLVGAIDSYRVEQVLDTLLRGIETSRAEFAIIDITGVPVVDTQVANTLLQAAQAVKLLGARVVLTGIRPEVAQTLVGLGVDLRQIITRSSLQSGIGYATEQR